MNHFDERNPEKEIPGNRVNGSGGRSNPNRNQPNQFNPQSASAQRARILARLRESPCTTYELMRNLDCYDPRPRVFELRKQGHKIETVWERVQTESGDTHRIGKYVLIAEPR